MVQENEDFEIDDHVQYNKIFEGDGKCSIIFLHFLKFVGNPLAQDLKLDKKYVNYVKNFNSKAQAKDEFINLYFNYIKESYSQEYRSPDIEGFNRRGPLHAIVVEKQDDELLIKGIISSEGSVYSYLVLNAISNKNKNCKLILEEGLEKKIADRNKKRERQEVEKSKI